MYIVKIIGIAALTILFGFLLTAAYHALVLYCLVGPSGCGKTTIAEMLEAEGYHSVQSYTTREPRYEGEEGHIFVSKDEFDKLDLITKTTFSGASYGVTRNLIEENDLFVVDPAGLRYLKEHYDGPKKIVAIAFSCPASVCKERILKRGDTKKEACTRLRHDKKAFKNFLKDCDYEIDATQSQLEILKQMKHIIETLNWWYEPDSNKKEIENV